jgi:hypothetical protein
MAIRKNGKITGKRGNTVTYFLNGKEVQRSIGIRTKPPTKAELINRQKMAVLNDFLQPVKEFLKKGFELQAKTKETYPYNMAIAYNMQNAFSKINPLLEIDFDKVLFSEGEMPINPEARVEVHEKGLSCSWDPRLMEKGMKRNDTVLVLAYCAEKKSAFFELSGARRTAGEEFLEITGYHQQVNLEVYISFVSADGKSISNSSHIGQVKF